MVDRGLPNAAVIYGVILVVPRRSLSALAGARDPHGKQDLVRSGPKQGDQVEPGSAQ